MTRKIMRNMARVQLEKEGRKKLNKKHGGAKTSTFSTEWKEAYIRNLVESLQRQGKTVRIVKRGTVNG